MAVVVALATTPAAAQLAYFSQPTPVAGAPDPYLFPIPSPAATGEKIDFTNSSGRIQVDGTADKSGCVIMIIGQSMAVNSAVSLYVPTNSAVHQFNIYNGGTYKYAEPQLGVDGTTGGWPGRLGDALVNAGKCTTAVVIANFSTSSTSIADWTTGNLKSKLIAGLSRLKTAGYVPSAIIWQQGIQDGSLGTSSAAYQASFATLTGLVTPYFASAPWFVGTETWLAGTTNATIQGAQAALVNHAGSPPVWVGANEDSLNASNRQADNTHWNDTGAAAVATLWKNALSAFGAPF